MRFRALAPFLPLLLVLGGRAQLRAQVQDSVRIVRGRIVLIAGADLHLAFTRSTELLPGDTLLVRRRGETAGALVVVAADSTRAVLGFGDSPFPLTRGDSIEAVLRPARRFATEPHDAGAPPSARTSVPEAAPMVRRTVARWGADIRLSGYLATEADWTRRVSGSGAVARTVPASTVSLRAGGLPIATQAVLFARITGGSAGMSGVVDRAGRYGLDVYVASVESRAGPVRIRVGRQASALAMRAASWDGLAVEVGHRFRIAADAGWERERWSVDTAGPRPRVSATAQFTGDVSTRTRYQGSVSALQFVGNRREGRVTTAVATRHALRSGPLHLWGDAALEADTAGVVLRWASLRTVLDIGTRSRMHAGYRRYAAAFPPAPLDSTATALTSDRLDAGVQFTARAAGFGINAAWSPDPQRASGSVSSHVDIRALPANLGFDLLAAYWQHNGSGTLTAEAGLTRHTGRIQARTAYRFERTMEDRTPGHEAAVDLFLAAGRRTTIELRAARSIAGTLTGSQIHLRLIRGF